MKKNARIASVVASLATACALASGLALSVSFSHDVPQAASTTTTTTNADGVRDAVTEGGVTYEANAALVVPAAGATASDVTRALASTAGVVAREPSASELEVGCVRVELDGTCSVEEAASRLEGQAAIASAQPNYRYVCLDEPSITAPSAQAEADQTIVPAAPDPDADELALGAASTSVNDPRASEQWALSAMGVYEAWDQAKVNQSVTVAALDLGCDVGHEDLTQNLLMPYNAYNAVHGGDVNDVSPISSNRNHGTHVAGIIGAGTDNGVGVAGTAFNARVMPIKVVDEAGNAYTDVLVNAYDYVLSHADEYNIRVINISMGSKVSSIPDNAFTAKIDEAWNRGIVTVAAAGNANQAAGWIAPFICYPSDYGNVVSVISLEERNGSYMKATASNYNAPGHTDKEISAPGSRILSTVPGGGYDNVSGTSMSTPQASAVLALEFAVNPSLSAQQAVDILYQTATDLGDGGFDEIYGYGMVNADAAVRQAASSGGQGSGRWKRLWGQTRYQTMQAVSQEGFSSSTWAVVTTADNFPDALSASVLAGACNCPILITGRSSLSPECSSELKRLGVTDVYVVGGTAAVSEATERSITGLGVRVTRIAGADRQGTSLEVMRQAKSIGANFDAVVVATGSSFPDSLSISPYAYASGVPILLTNSAGMLTEAEVAEVLATPKVKRAIIVGGTSAVSQQVEAQLGAGIACERIWGNDRYLTSAEIVRWEIAHGLSWAHPAVATGENYPDALTGAALAGNRHSPLVLAHASTDVGVGLVQEAHGQVQSGYVLGGTSAVSDQIASALNVG